MINLKVDVKTLLQGSKRLSLYFTVNNAYSERRDILVYLANKNALYTT
jgi:hypothetical protein